LKPVAVLNTIVCRLAMIHSRGTLRRRCGSIVAVCGFALALSMMSQAFAQPSFAGNYFWRHTVDSVKRRSSTAMSAADEKEVSSAERKDNKEVIYNYYSNDYALVERTSSADVIAASVDDFVTSLLPWSDGEKQILQIMEENSPKWRTAALGPDDEAGLRRNFRSIAEVAGSEEAALKLLERNSAVILFGPTQTGSAGKALVECLGKEKAMALMQKNPGVLTIDPKGLIDNIAATVFVADIIDVIAENAEVSKVVASVVQLFFAVALVKALSDVVRISILPRISEIQW